ncbi:MAG: glycosyltransferase family 9 protein, partial [Gemmatimonadetes bacterium]|nr:glycosyltransferase family 9 protein [Gemmatimonadota bacterium]
HEVGWRGHVHEIVRFQDAVETIAGGAGTTLAGAVRVDPDIAYLLNGAAHSVDHTRDMRAAGAAVAAAGRGGMDDAVGTGEEYVVLHPGTRARKRWPDARWRGIATSFLEAGRTVVVTGTAEERPWLAAVFEGLPVTLAAGTTSVADLAAIFRRATLYVGTDSFASHLAALAGTPRVVVIWNRFADPVQWAPVGAGRVVIVDPAASPTEVVRSAFASVPRQRDATGIRG